MPRGFPARASKPFTKVTEKYQPLTQHQTGSELKALHERQAQRVRTGAAERPRHRISSHGSHLSQAEEIQKKEKAAKFTAALGKGASSHGHAPEVFSTSCERTHHAYSFKECLSGTLTIVLLKLKNN